MAILSVPLNRLHKHIISACDVDIDLLRKICIESYTLYPTSEHNFIPDVITAIYNSITYGDYSGIDAGVNISSYLDESQLLTDLISIHKKISILLLNNTQMIVKNIQYIEMAKDKAIFKVIMED
jgi:hypothetical protein